VKERGEGGLKAYGTLRRFHSNFTADFNVEYTITQLAPKPSDSTTEIRNIPTGKTRV
jgi:hypothetical protein